jgi:hypothetical protein
LWGESGMQLGRVRVLPRSRLQGLQSYRLAFGRSHMPRSDLCGLCRVCLHPKSRCTLESQSFTQNGGRCCIAPTPAPRYGLGLGPVLVRHAATWLGAVARVAVVGLGRGALAQAVGTTQLATRGTRPRKVDLVLLTPATRRAVASVLVQVGAVPAQLAASTLRARGSEATGPAVVIDVVPVLVGALDVGGHGHHALGAALEVEVPLVQWARLVAVLDLANQQGFPSYILLHVGLESCFHPPCGAWRWQVDRSGRPKVARLAPPRRPRRRRWRLRSRHAG